MFHFNETTISSVFIEANTIYGGLLNHAVITLQNSIVRDVASESVSTFGMLMLSFTALVSHTQFANVTGDAASLSFNKAFSGFEAVYQFRAYTCNFSALKAPSRLPDDAFAWFRVGFTTKDTIQHIVHAGVLSGHCDLEMTSCTLNTENIAVMRTGSNGCTNINAINISLEEIEVNQMDKTAGLRDWIRLHDAQTGWLFFGFFVVVFFFWTFLINTDLFLTMRQ